MKRPNCPNPSQKCIHDQAMPQTNLPAAKSDTDCHTRCPTPLILCSNRRPPMMVSLIHADQIDQQVLQSMCRPTVPSIWFWPSCRLTVRETLESVLTVIFLRAKNKKLEDTTYFVRVTNCSYQNCSANAKSHPICLILARLYRSTFCGHSAFRGWETTLSQTAEKAS